MTTPLTLCLMPHRRDLDPGDDYTAADGTTVTVAAPMSVWDHVQPRHGDWDGARLCTGHLARLRQLVATTPGTVGWLRQQVVPGARTGDGEWRPPQRRAAAPVPLNLGAVDAADIEFAVLAAWCRITAEERHEPVPKVGGWAGPITAAGNYGRRPVPDGDTQVHGLRGDNTTAVTVATKWLLARLDWCAEQLWVDEMLRELGSLRGKHRARWPVEDGSRRIPGLVCSRCGRETVTLWPPTLDPVWTQAERDPAGRVTTPARPIWSDPVQIGCADLRCGQVVPPAEWEATLTAAHELQRRGA